MHLDNSPTCKGRLHRIPSPSFDLSLHLDTPQNLLKGHANSVVISQSPIFSEVWESEACSRPLNTQKALLKWTLSRRLLEILHRGWRLAGSFSLPCGQQKLPQFLCCHWPGPTLGASDLVGQWSPLREGTQQILRNPDLYIQVEWLLFCISMTDQTPHRCFPMRFVRWIKKIFRHAHMLHFSL